MGRPYKCPYCGQTASIGKGVRKTKTMGNRSVRLCKRCGRKFTPKNQTAILEEAESDAETSEADMVAANPAEPATANDAPNQTESPEPILNALDQEWTS